MWLLTPHHMATEDWEPLTPCLWLLLFPGPPFVWLPVVSVCSLLTTFWEREEDALRSSGVCFDSGRCSGLRAPQVSSPTLHKPPLSPLPVVASGRMDPVLQSLPTSVYLCVRREGTSTGGAPQQAPAQAWVEQR